MPRKRMTTDIQLLLAPLSTRCNGQLHALASLAPWKEPLIHTEQQAVWPPEADWML